MHAPGVNPNVGKPRSLSDRSVERPSARSVDVLPAVLNLALGRRLACWTT